MADNHPNKHNLQQKPLGWIAIILLAILAVVIGIAINRYFLCTPFILDGGPTLGLPDCSGRFNFWKSSFWTSSPAVNASLAESIFWARLASPEEPLNMRNLILGLASMVGLILLAWRSYAMDKRANTAESQRQIDQKNLELLEKKYLDDKNKIKAQEQKTLDGRFEKAVQVLSTVIDTISQPSHYRAIIELRDLALDNNAYVQRCLDMLCSCNQWMEGYLENFIAPFSDDCYADRHLTEDNRIVKDKKKGGYKVKLEQERISQRSLLAISYVIKKLGNDNAKKHILGELDLSGKMLCGINLSNSEISGINLNNAYLNGANLSYSQMQHAYLSRTKMKKANLKGVNLQESNLCYAELQGADMQNVNLQKSNLKYAQLQGSNLPRAHMQGVIMENANLQNSNMNDVNLQNANMKFIQGQGVNLRNANMLGVLLYETQMQRASLIGANLKGANLEDANLTEVDLTVANLQDAKCAETIFEKAKLVEANLKGASLRENVLRDADLTGANLYATDLTEAYIYGTNFHNANIQKATLIGADITGSDLTGANMTESNLQGISIRETKCQRTIFNQAKVHAVNFIDCDLQGSMFISSELQGASFNASNLENCILLGCNLYGVEMENNNLQNIIFDAISDTGHIKTKDTRNTWIKGIGKGLIDSANDEEHISRIQQAWDKTDKREMPKGLNALQQASILEKDAKGHWVIKPSNIEELREFYRALVTELYKGLFIPLSDFMDMISKGHEPLSKNYPKVQKTLKAILAEFKKELKNKG